MVCVHLELKLELHVHSIVCSLYNLLQLLLYMLYTVREGTSKFK